jgi:hypothetical protein
MHTHEGSEKRWGILKMFPGKMFLGSMYQGKEYMASHVY